MSLQCIRCRSLLAAIAAGQVGESERIEVEAHLGGCSGCSEEQARWQVIGELRAAPTQRLSSEARDRVRRAMMKASQETLARREERGRVALPWRLSLAGVAALALLVGGLALRSRSVPGAAGGDGAEVVSGELALAGVQAAAGAAIADGQTLETAAGAATVPGSPVATVRLDGSTVDLAGGSRATWDRARHTLRLDRGQVTVELPPGRGLSFRVAAERFAAEVIGTRFVATPSSVYTLHGRVRIVGADGAELTVLGPGQLWTLPAAASPPAPPAARAPAAPAPVAPSPVPPPAPAAAAPQAAPTPAMAGAGAPDRSRAGGASAVAAASPRSAASASQRATLAAARAAIARRDTGEARRLLEGLIDGQNSGRRVSAEARSLLAEAAMVDGRRDEQLALLRDVAQRYPRLPEAENALYGVVLFESEASHAFQARRAGADYLARYPRGRFAADVRARLQRLEPR